MRKFLKEKKLGQILKGSNKKLKET